MQFDNGLFRPSSMQFYDGEYHPNDIIIGLTSGQIALTPPCAFIFEQSMAAAQKLATLIAGEFFMFKC